MADVVRNPAFEQKELDRLRQQALAGIRQEQNQPVSIALRSLPPLMYGEDHVYGIPFTGSGTLESVSAITRDDLVSFHQSWIRPDNATVFVVGDTTMAEIQPILEKAFGNWQAATADRKTKTLTTVKLPEHGRVIIVDRPGSPQSLILAGHLAPATGADNNIAIETMNDILGGQFTARVNMNLREEKGWAYGAYTFLQDARGQRPFFVYAPVQTDKTAQSMAELVKELNAIMGERPATEKELDMAVKNSVRSLPGQFETSASVLGAMLSNARFERPLNYQESLKADYEALGLMDVEAAAEEVIHPDQLIWMVIGDREKIEDSIRELDFGDVEVRSVER
jgi:zinc protease